MFNIQISHAINGSLFRLSFEKGKNETHYFSEMRPSASKWFLKHANLAKFVVF